MVEFLGAGDLADLQRLDEVFSDGEGWGLPKARVQRLAELGVIRHCGGGRYQITSFGSYCLGLSDHLPLETVAQHNDRMRREMEARNAQLEGIRHA